MIRLVTSAILVVGLASAASAASLSVVSGPVLVDSGKGFVKVSTNAELAPGSRVMVSKGGNAALAYADGCSKTLGPNTVTTVVGSGACAPAAQVAAQAKSPLLAPAIVIGGTAALVTGLAFAADDNASNNSTPIVPPISN